MQNFCKQRFFSGLIFTTVKNMQTSTPLLLSPTKKSIKFYEKHFERRYEKVTLQFLLIFFLIYLIVRSQTLAWFSLLLKSLWEEVWKLLWRKKIIPSALHSDTVGLKDNTGILRNLKILKQFLKMLIILKFMNWLYLQLPALCFHTKHCMCVCHCLCHAIWSWHKILTP